MLNKNGERELCYVVKVDDIQPIQGRDKVECAVIGGWTCMVRKGQFNKNDLGIYFEIDSKVDTSKDVFKFTEKYNGKIKTQKFSIKDEDGNKIGQFWSQGLLMSAEDFGWELIHIEGGKSFIARPSKEDKRITSTIDNLYEGDFLTKELGVTYAEVEDNKRKSSSGDKYKKMANRHPKLFQNPIIKKIYKTKLGKRILFVFFGKKKDSKQSFPDGKFIGVSRTDQERCENMTWVLQDKTPFIVTQKCDGSSGTYILERKGKNKFEFYICSRNVRILNDKQECYHDSNYYWEVALKYDIENKMKKWLQENPTATFICWQGEICSPNIQKNPHHLKETHFYCFHWTDSINGRLDIRKANRLWKEYNMEVVPIIDTNYILPDNFEEFKKSADGYYDPICCEGQSNCIREGYVYYKTTDPTFSFKNVSREYLGKK